MYVERLPLAALPTERGRADCAKERGPYNGPISLTLRAKMARVTMSTPYYCQSTGSLVSSTTTTNFFYYLESHLGQILSLCVAKSLGQSLGQIF